MMKNVFAHRFRTARLIAGLSQQDLADKLAITKQSISKYERSLMLPDSSQLIKISNVLHCSPDYFFRPLTVKLEHVEFRKRSKLRGKKLEAVKAKVIDEVERYLELEELLGINHPFVNPIKKILINSFDDVENACDKLLKKWHLGYNPLPNIIEMVEDNGVKVIEIDAAEDFDGLSDMVGDAIPVIVVNKKTDIVRKRFNLLHELGHILLQISDEANKKEKERFCNRFAGGMLIPKEILFKELGRKRNKFYIKELIEIKEYFGISIAAIVYRASELGIIHESYCKRFWQKRNQDKNLKLERDGYGKYQGKESSGRFQQLLYKALAEEIITVSKAAYLAKTEASIISENLQLF
ncbi:MAG: XRE family transcriptional regulator [Bacteroidota bacterium]